MKKLWHLARLIWLNIGFYGCLLFMTAAGMFFVAVPAYCWLRFARRLDTGKSTRRLIWYYGRAWSKLLAAFVPLRVENCSRPLPKPCIITPNHQSFFDTYCFGFAPEPDVVFAVRAWPFKMPFYGPYMRHAEYLNTENGSAEALLRQAREILARGTCIAVFPEGTRSPDGEMQRFHGGAFHLAVVANVPVVPLCIEGTGQFLRKGSFLLRPATIAVRMLEPVWPEQFASLGHEAPLMVRRTVKARLQQALLEMRNPNLEAIPSTCVKEYV